VRGRRLFAAGEVQAAGHGALAIVSAITGIARSTINRGEDDLDEGPLPEGRIRRKGGGGMPLSPIFCGKPDSTLPEYALADVPRMRECEVTRASLRSINPIWGHQ
jgi:hypothetical protein